MRFLLLAGGSHGDIHPFLAIAQAMRVRGHEVFLGANPYFQRLVESVGATFIPLGEHFDLRDLSQMPDVMHPRRGTRVVLDKLIRPTAEVLFRDLPRLLKEITPDAVVAHHILIGAEWVCRREGMPVSQVVLAPIAWLSKGDAVSPKPPVPLNPGWFWKWFVPWAGRAVMRKRLDPAVARLRRDGGFPPMKEPFINSALAGDLNLGMWSSVFRPAVSGDQPNTRICGFPWFDRHPAQELSIEQLQRFIKAGPPPIVFTLGTAAVHVAGDFYEQAATVAARLKRRAVLLVGSSGRTVQSAMGNADIGVFNYAPFSTLFPHCACVVHHGGIGTTAQTMRAGVPSLVIPHGHDQFDNGARIFRLGLGGSLPRTRVSLRSLERALRDVLDQPTMAAKAGDIATRLRDEDGAITATQMLENQYKKRS